MPASRKEETENEETSPKRIKLAEAADKKSTLACILEKEIRNEISIRRNDLETIEQRIYETRQSLVKIRQGIVAEFYKQNSKQGILQTSPHPAVKDTFQGKCPVKKPNVNNEEQTQNLNANVSDSQETPLYENLNGCETNELAEYQQFSKIPRYIPPRYRDKDIVQLCEPRGNVKKKKFRISIVNVSKWIFDENGESKGATHKWTVYVKNSDPEIDITSIISKVTFFLHHSYKPNDVITVEYAPFKLTRRGWGEFPLRVQLHFINSLDKPVDVVHQLKLDTTHSGLDIFGTETVVDVWAHCNENESNKILSGNNLKQEILASSSSSSSSSSPCTDQLPSSSPVKPAIYPAEDYLSASSLSQLSLPSIPTEISNDILSEIFGDNDEVENKCEIKEIEFDQTLLSTSNEVILNDSCSADKEKIFKYEECKVKEDSDAKNTDFSCMVENTSSESKQIVNVTSLQEHPSIYNKHIPSENIEYKFSNDLISNSTLSSAKPPSDITFTDQLHEAFPNEQSTNDVTSYFTSSEEINNAIDASSKITYNPIECLNFVNDEVVIKSEEDEDDRNKQLGNSTSSLSCKNYLENFVDLEIQNGDSEGGEVKQEVIITDDEYINSTEVPKIEFHQNTQVMQPVVNEAVSFIQTDNKNISLLEDNKKFDSTLPMTLGTTSGSDFVTPCTVNSASQSTVHLSRRQLSRSDSTNSANNSMCLNRRLPISINKGSTITLANIENVIKTKNNKNKFIVKDAKSIKNLIVSPVKSSSDQTKICNLKVRNSKIEEIIKNKNEAIILVNNDEVTDLLNKNVTNKDKLLFNKNNSLKLGNNSLDQSARNIIVNKTEVKVLDKNRNQPMQNDTVKKKLYIEMPNGELREISSGILTSTNESKLMTTSSNKPIIIESQAIIKKRNNIITTSGTGSTEIIPFNSTESSNMKRMVIKPGYKIISSNPAKVKLNEQTSLQQNTRLVLPVKTLQKSKQSLLKLTATGESFQPTMKSTVVNAGNSPQFIRIVGNQPLVLDNSKIVIQRKVLPGESLLKKGYTALQVDTNRPEVTASLPGVLIDKELIKRCPTESIEFAVNWLIKHFPLVNERAGIESFKRKHPYCAIDRVTFLKWPLAKQRAAEMMRAKKISKLLTKICPHLKQWKTLQIIDWARLRGYTPCGQPLRCSNLSVVNSGSFLYTAPDITSILTNKKLIDKEQIDIDVESEADPVMINKVQSTSDDRLYFPLDKRFKNIGDFLFKSCDNIGVHFYEEELIPGVIYPTVERALISVLHSVVDDLFRRSLNASCMRKGFIPASEVTLEDVKMALLSRREFDIFTNEGLGVTFSTQKDNK